MKIASVLNVLSLQTSERDFEIIREQLIDAGYNLNISRVEKESEFEFSFISTALREGKKLYG